MRNTLAGRKGPALSSRPFWEDAYRRGTSDPFGSASSEVVGLLDRLPAGAEVLDLGCGMGRNAIPLARAGMRLTCVDVSDAACARVSEIAQVMSLDVRVICEDMHRFDLTHSYDAIIAHGVLHLLARDTRLDLLARMKLHTTPGGLNVVAVFTDRLPAPPDLVDEFVGLFEEGELAAVYSDWAIELEQAYTLEDEHGEGIRHVHPVNKVVASKSAGAASAG
jgi:tellurite methyltransferase